ncbi:MAG: hypothetical protein KGH71_01870 [Candidatus Micrarchaeota archaeon]|nr:hypothetical protein [Candidatus Micrarchaeota archaeon]
MAPNPNFQRQGNRSPSKIRLYALIAIVVVVAAYFVFAGSSISHISATQSFTVPTNGTIYFTLPNNTNIYSLFVKSSSNASATLYVSGMPILVRPIMVLLLSSGEGENLSSSSGSSANINIVLESSTPGQAKLTLTPLPASLGIRVSPSVGVINPSVILQGGTVSSAATTTTVTTSVTTTVSGSHTTVTTSIATTATTTVASSIPTAQVMAYANATALGALAKNLKTLYVNGQSCTPAQYNATYQAKFGSQPTGPNAYSSIVTFTPTNLNFAIQQVDTSLYNVTYTLVAPDPRVSGAVLRLEINNANGALVTSTFLPGGPWSDLTTELLTANYNFAAGIGNNCGILLP